MVGEDWAALVNGGAGVGEVFWLGLVSTRHSRCRCAPRPSRRVARHQDLRGCDGAGARHQGYRPDSCRNTLEDSAWTPLTGRQIDFEALSGNVLPAICRARRRGICASTMHASDQQFATPAEEHELGRTSSCLVNGYRAARSNSPASARLMPEALGVSRHRRIRRGGRQIGVGDRNDHPVRHKRSSGRTVQQHADHGVPRDRPLQLREHPRAPAARR